ncbi:MAG: hypothetical protein JWO92_720 [Chitinophagaceae bacterium]|nr:hypothetical protein [Chitinophagaceae bacterium]
MMKNIKWLCILLIGFSCGPKVYYFKPLQSNVSPGDTIRLDWKVRGKPVMLVHEKTAADDPANIKPGGRLMEFILAFKNSDKYGTAQVIITPPETSDTVFLRTKDLHGDTLIAYGIKSPEDYFTIHGVTSVMNRALFVWHGNKMIALEPGDSSPGFNDTPVGGEWKIGTLLSPAEKKDHSIIPSDLKLLIVKKHK